MKDNKCHTTSLYLHQSRDSLQNLEEKTSVFSLISASVVSGRDINPLHRQEVSIFSIFTECIYDAHLFIYLYIGVSYNLALQHYIRFYHVIKLNNLPKD